MKKVSVLLTAGVLAISMFGPTTASAGGTHLIANPDSVRHGMTYPQWEGAYQVWLNGIPTPKNPLVDPGSPRNCEPQPGHTVFAGPFGADCHVPSGSSIVFGTFFWECSTAEGLGETYRELRDCAISNFDHDFGPDGIHTTVTVDGQRLHHPRKWIFLTPGEVIHFPENNIYNVEPGRSKSVTEGTLYILKPLSDGTHHVHVHGVDSVIGAFNVDWTFHVS